MNTIIRKANSDDLKYILGLSNKEGHAVGFIPKPAYEAAITGIKRGKRWSLTCNDKLWVAEENGDLVGYLMASFGKIVKVNQICIQEDARKIERGKALIDVLEEYSSGIGKYQFGCGCADDLESNIFWTALGWDRVGQRKGIHFSNTWKQSSDRNVNLYRYYGRTQLVMPMFKEMEGTKINAIQK